jgi:hypothetical protein
MYIQQTQDYQCIVGVASREQHRTQLCHEQISSHIIHGLPGHLKTLGAASLAFPFHKALFPKIEGGGEGEEEGAGEH